MSQAQYDLVVIGAGSGGMATAQRAAAHGARVAMVESGPVGGTCIHSGCVPKKATWLAAQLAYAQDIGREYGFPVKPTKIDWGAFVERRDAFIAGIERRYRERFASAGVEIIAAEGRIVGPGRVRAGERELGARHILVATGSRPVVPDIDGADLGETSDDFFGWQAQPRRVALIGGGYISVELAGMLCALGTEVTLFAREQQLLEKFDAESADFLASRMRGERIDVRCGVDVTSLVRDGAKLTVECREGGTKAGFDRVLWAVGRAPRTRGIGLESVGVKTDGRGRIEVDDEFDTSAAHVHALGDCSTLRPLTPVAVACGRRLADRLFATGEPVPVDLGLIPSVVFGHPPLASVGLSEAQARARHGDGITIHRGRFRALRTALGGRDCESFVKLICTGDDERVIGLHMVGENTDEVLQGFAVAMRCGATKRDFDATIAVHPSTGEEVVTLV
ncbi:glutathione-disulfide reductase [Coralloluteibacterium stylophorae]|uniref:Glutathione-disulfide reductase n=1 Tax=Coralloluteibacterium stylophorae TaxID=1776034 RepID=A0A8J8AZI3_9GAMM|nr:glutathione-disulfide reductase [Coralloluteibacterium stylophorae]MBS7456456.1 glutathione-disulfide reductase [Coralloluteibacterium stylophorae]